MTEAQKKLVELEKKKTALKDFYDAYEQALRDVEGEIGMNGFFQDNEGTVYHLVVPEGRFVHYETIAVERTRRLHMDEKKGSLSLTKAREAGFIVEGK